MKECALRIKPARYQFELRVPRKRDANGNQIIVIGGARFYYLAEASVFEWAGHIWCQLDEGRAAKAGNGALGHVWASEIGQQLFFYGPDYRFMYLSLET